MLQFGHLLCMEHQDRPHQAVAREDLRLRLGRRRRPRRLSSSASFWAVSIISIHHPAAPCAKYLHRLSSQPSPPVAANSLYTWPVLAHEQDDDI